MIIINITTPTDNDNSITDNRPSRLLVHIPCYYPFGKTRVSVHILQLDLPSCRRGIQIESLKVLRLQNGYQRC